MPLFIQHADTQRRLIQAMSLLSRKVQQQGPQVVKSGSFFHITPQTHPGVVSTSESLRVQQTVIGNMQRECADLFSSNSAVKSNQNDQDIYHTSGLYGKSISVEELRDTMQEFDLSCAVSFSSPSANCTTLSMLDAKHLTKENLRAGYVSLPAGERGNMVVSFKKHKGKHYIQSVDFHVPEQTGQ